MAEWVVQYSQRVSGNSAGTIDCSLDNLGFFWPNNFSRYLTIIFWNRWDISQCQVQDAYHIISHHVFHVFIMRSWVLFGLSGYWYPPAPYDKKKLRGWNQANDFAIAHGLPAPPLKAGPVTYAKMR